MEKKKDKFVVVRVRDELKQKIQEVAIRCDIPASVVARKALARGLQGFDESAVISK